MAFDQGGYNCPDEKVRDTKVPKRAKPLAPIELDVDRYELRRGGLRINLERIPLDLLILLVQSGGRLLPREEIVDHLWGKNPWLDAERNVNTAIGKIRRALDDDADQPRFVETVVGKGYRFIASIRTTDEADAGLVNGAAPFILLRASGNPVNAAALPPPAIPNETQLTFPLISEAGTGEAGKPVTNIQRHSIPGWSMLAGGGLMIVIAGLAVAVIWTHFGPQPSSTFVSYNQITHGGSNMEARIGGIPLPILTDSSRLYFPASTVGGDYQLGQVAAVGGQAGILATSLASPLALDISRDGSQLLVASPAALPVAPLWVQPIPSGAPRRLGNLQAQSASWSPDGQRVAYSTLSGLYSAKTDGSDIRHLVSIDPHSGKQIYWPRWSPDGTQIRYSLYIPETGYHSLWQVGVDGRHPHALLPGWNPVPHQCCGSWTHDGRFFVFASIRNGRSDIWAMPEKAGWFGRGAGRPFQVTAGPINFSSPLPAANGHLFVVGTQANGELVRYDPGSKTLVPWFRGISAVGVCSSKDGKWLTYTTYPERILWRSRLDGTERLQLTLPSMQAYLPRWSPDGSRIAFYARSLGMPSQIYIVSANGGTPQRLLPSETNQIDPTWSPDGHLLTFESAPWVKRGGGRKTEIDIVDIGSRKETVVPGSVGLVSPRWSPDGRFIAAMPSDSSGLVLLDVQSHTWEELMRRHIGYPNWSHNGRYIYFDSFQTPVGIGRISIVDRSIEHIVTLQPGHDLWTLDDWTGLTSDDSVLLLRNASMHEIYDITWKEP